MANVLPASSLETLSLVVVCPWVISNYFASIKEGNVAESTSILFESLGPSSHARNVLLLQPIVVVYWVINLTLSYLSITLSWIATVGCHVVVVRYEYDRLYDSWDWALPCGGSLFGVMESGQYFHHAAP